MRELTRYRELFPLTGQYAFLDHAASAPVGNHVRVAVEQLLERRQREPFALIRRELGQLQRRFKERAARLLNAARPDEIVVMPNTAAGINTAANSLPLAAGDNVVILDGDYPANSYPWQNLVHRGIQVRQIAQRDGGLDLDLLQAAIDRRTRVIALSSVMFASGCRNDLASVGALCRERGIFFVVDAIQSVGVLPVDVQAWNIDFLACGSQKWLLPGEAKPHTLHAAVSAEGRSGVRRIRLRDFQVISDSGPDFAGYNLGDHRSTLRDEMPAAGVPASASHSSDSSIVRAQR